MSAKGLYSIPVLLALCHVIHEVTGQQCSLSEQKRETSILGMMLQGHIFKKITGATLGNICLQECYRDVRCQSFNFVIYQDMCELNNRTKEARPEDFVPNSARYYFRRDWERVMLGSIPELPAETCKEIKASEGGQAVSGEYWFDSIVPGETVLAHCDMKKEDVDECSASVPVCDVNADCKNTGGSYRCTCKVGFTGDGKTCTDIDECSGSLICDVNANCQNTPGSHTCSCKHGFYGDGQYCTLYKECQNYQTLNGADRNVNYYNTYTCDNGLGPGWFRFEGAAGTRMPTSCPPTHSCNAHVPGWLNGGHPSVADGKATRQVCFHWMSNCCYKTTNILVINCGSFYVYFFNGTPWCYLRYCGTN